MIPDPGAALRRNSFALTVEKSVPDANYEANNRKLVQFTFSRAIKRQKAETETENQ